MRRQRAAPLVLLARPRVRVVLGFLRRLSPQRSRRSWRRRLLLRLQTRGFVLQRVWSVEVRRPHGELGPHFVYTWIICHLVADPSLRFSHLIEEEVASSLAKFLADSGSPYRHFFRMRYSSSPVFLSYRCIPRRYRTPTISAG